jgi:hypothetical protein
MSKFIIQNAIYVPEKDLYVISGHCHDYREITLDDGKTFMIDGGRDYFRSGGDFDLLTSGRVIKFHLESTDSFTEKIVPMLLWGNRGINGDQPVSFRPLESYTTDHLKAIKANCPNASRYHKLVVHHILYKRGAL